jgi:hypothetical protein
MQRVSKAISLFPPSDAGNVLTLFCQALEGRSPTALCWLRAAGAHSFTCGPTVT